MNNFMTKPPTFDVPTSIVRTIGLQLKSMHSFASADILEKVKTVWEPTQNVLEFYGIAVSSAEPAPMSDYDVPEFKQKVLDLVRPPLSHSIAALLEDPSPQILELLEEIDPNQVSSYKEKGIISGDAAAMLESSVRLYLSLGSQIEVIHHFLTSRNKIEAEQLRQAKLTFIFSRLSTNVLNIREDLIPAHEIAYQAAIKEVVRPRLDKRLNDAIQACTTFPELSEIHGITGTMLDKFVDAGIISKHIPLHAREKLKRESIFRRIANLFSRQHK